MSTSSSSTYEPLATFSLPPPAYPTDLLRQYADSNHSFFDSTSSVNSHEWPTLTDVYGKASAERDKASTQSPEVCCSSVFVTSSSSNDRYASRDNGSHPWSSPGDDIDARLEQSVEESGKHDCKWDDYFGSRQSRPIQARQWRQQPQAKHELELAEAVEKWMESTKQILGDGSVSTESEVPYRGAEAAGTLRDSVLASQYLRCIAADKAWNRTRNAILARDCQNREACRY